MLVIALFGALAALLGLPRYEPRRAEPLIDLRFFRSAASCSCPRCACGTCAVLFTAFEAETSDVMLVIGYALFGVGVGVGTGTAPLTDTAVSGMPRARAGVAAAVASTSRQPGQTPGVAVVGALPASGVGSSSYRSAFVPAARPGWRVLVACGAAVLVLDALTGGRRAGRTAGRTAERLRENEVRQAAAIGARAAAETLDAASDG